MTKPSSASALSASQIITVDGTAASGKGTLARRLAQELGFAYLDTGALYRLVALRMIQENHPASDEQAAAGFARDLARSFTLEDMENPAIRTDEVGQMTSKTSLYPSVRSEIIDLQRNYAKNPPPLPTGAPARGAILDGRDIGTVVCPGAPLKLFVTAKTEIRAERRHKELQSKGIPATYEAVLAEMRERDARDAGRETSPMKPAADAVILDTSQMTIQQVLETAMALVKSRTGFLATH